MNRMTADEFCEHIEEEDFFRRYGNPVFVTRDAGDDLVCMAWEYYERLTALASAEDTPEEK